MSKSWAREMELSPGTFGNSPACHVLVDMMNHDVIPTKEKHRVLSFITSTVIREYKAIGSITDPGIRTSIMWRSRDDFVKRINAMPYPQNFVTFLRNVIYHLARKYLNEANV